MRVDRFGLRMSRLWTCVILTRPQAAPLLPGCVPQVPVLAAAAADPEAAGSQGWLCTSTERMELSFKISFSQQRVSAELSCILFTFFHLKFET